MQVRPNEIERLRSLDCWWGPIEVETLGGGITNHNYRVRFNENEFVARLSVERPFLGIDRRNELLCQRLAFERGIAPEVVHHEDGALVSRFLSGRTLTTDDFREQSTIVRVADLLRLLHTPAPAGAILGFCAFQTVQTYAETSRTLGAELPTDIDFLLEECQRLSDQTRRFEPVLCHNDLLASNLVADNDHVWLVNWEYAGIGNPLFDLAGLAANNAFTEAMEVELLTVYRGTLEPEDLRDLQMLKAASHLREALWSVIQTVASEIEFDYHRYADKHFSAYRDALRRMLH